MEAINEHGASLASQRVVFRTARMLEPELTDKHAKGATKYNETACCVAVSQI